MQDIHSEVHPMKPGGKRSMRNMVRDTKREVTVMGPIYRQAPDESLGK